MPIMNPLSCLDARYKDAYEHVNETELFGNPGEPPVLSLPAVKEFRVISEFIPGKDGIVAVDYSFRESHKSLIERDVPEISLRMLPTVRMASTRSVMVGRLVPYAHIRALIRIHNERVLDVLSLESPNVFRDENGVVEVICEGAGWYILTHSTGSTYLYPIGTQIFFLPAEK